MTSNENRVAALVTKGVEIPDPTSVFIGPDVDIERISADGVVLHPGTRITGAATLICDRAMIGTEAPCTVFNSHIGPRVQLAGGVIQEAVFLADARMGSSAHIRGATILEEASSGAHSVGLKQTILFPFVTLGSLINFCDVFMAGGTDGKNHSEVGSSYIHFNYTPNQDKATPSLIGDVPAGVMLDQQPIFLGGQGGLVGPSRIAYGTVIAAGSIYRKDVLEPNRLVADGGGRRLNVARKVDAYHGLERIISNNLHYVANLIALDAWYGSIRQEFIGPNLPNELLIGLNQALTSARNERINRLAQLAEKMPGNVSGDAICTDFKNAWPRIADSLNQAAPDAPSERDQFLQAFMSGAVGVDYLDTIRNTPASVKTMGRNWLAGIVNRVLTATLSHLPRLSA